MRENCWRKKERKHCGTSSTLMPKSGLKTVTVMSGYPTKLMPDLARVLGLTLPGLYWSLRERHALGWYHGMARRGTTSYTLTNMMILVLPAPRPQGCSIM